MHCYYVLLAKSIDKVQLVLLMVWSIGFYRIVSTILILKKIFRKTFGSSRRGYSARASGMVIGIQSLMSRLYIRISRFAYIGIAKKIEFVCEFGCGYLKYQVRFFALFAGDHYRYVFLHLKLVL